MATDAATRQAARICSMSRTEITAEPMKLLQIQARACYVNNGHGNRVSLTMVKTLSKKCEKIRTKSPLKKRWLDEDV